MLNIYFDIDGVLLGTKSPKKDVEALLLYALKNYPDSLFWLTTHCWHGANRAKEVLSREFDSGFVEKVCEKFQVAFWEDSKTEGIDFDQDFVWFDDNLFESEKIVLESHYVLDSFFKMNPRDPGMAKKALLFLKSFEK